MIIFLISELMSATLIKMSIFDEYGTFKMIFNQVLYTSISCLILLNLIIFFFTASFYRTFWNHVYNNKLFMFFFWNVAEGIFWIELCLVCHRTFRILLTKLENE